MNSYAAQRTNVPLTPRAQTLVAGKYRLEHEIGGGAMGTVWLATHVSLGQQVAIKFISKQLVQSAEARLRFETEARSAALLRSRFAVQVHDTGETEDGIPYIVMEYLEGDTLERAIQQRGAMPLPDAVRMIWQVARALSRAHALSITHRDLKPANILLARLPDEGEVAKVLDFGVAKMADSTNQFTTQTGALVGTPLFMSPEQIRGMKDVDHRTDLYSLGMVAFNALAGRQAVAHDTFADLVLALCVQPLPSLTDAAPWLPPNMNDWFQRACAREPGQRFQSADELADALLVASGLSAASLNQVQTAETGTRARSPSTVPTRLSAGLGVAAGQSSSVQAISGVVSPSVAPRPRSILPWLLAGVVTVSLLAGVLLVVLLKRHKADTATREDHRVATTSEKTREMLSRLPPAPTTSTEVAVVPTNSVKAGSVGAGSEQTSAATRSPPKAKPIAPRPRPSVRPKKKPIDVGF